MAKFRLSRPTTVCSLTFQHIQDCKVGRKGKRAVGVTVAKMFDGVEFRGEVDMFRQVRQRYYYHVTYSDGDEEELSQVELRDGYLLGLSGEIEAQWSLLEGVDKGKEVVDTKDQSEGQTSDGEGSEYDRHDYESEVKKTKRKRKENTKRSNTKTN